MSSSTPHTQSLLRRKQQVYVEIPPSPFHTPRPSATSPATTSYPLSPSRSNMPQAPDVTTKKRKLSNAQLPNPKNPKLELKSRPQKENALGPSSADECTTIAQGTATYCHQCGKKREITELVFCTATHTLVKSGKERRCTAKYCRPCIRNRYSRDSESTRASEQRLEKMPIKYTCPKCRDICNCSGCRRAKGLEPLGKQPFGPGNNGVQEEKLVPNSKPSLSVSTLDAARPNPSTKLTTKPLPNIRWQSLPVKLSLEEAEARIQIREFVLRFDKTVGRNIGRGNLEELECITRNDDENAPTNWVSEGCVKAVILGLLGTLSDEEDSSAAMVIQKTIKEIRSAGINLTKIWTSLAALRDVLCTPDNDTQSTRSDNSQSSEDRIIIEFPDPLPAPECIVANYNTRSSRSATNKDASPAVTIANSSQLVPVIIGLMNTVVESHTVREELEEGIKRGKEYTREAREGIKRENERWERLKQVHDTLPSAVAVAKVKEDRHTHRETILGLESSLKIVLSSSMPRFSPLGTDHDGRVYWALSPGIRDREFATSVINVGSGTTKSAKSRKPIRRPKSSEERASFNCWSWFIVVRGRRPSLGGPDKIEPDSGESEEGWWVFWEPEEIRKLSSWITIRNELDAKPEDCDRVRNQQQLRNLVKNLHEYSTILEWRCKGGEEML